MEHPKITVATYNVLADAYVKPEYYPGVDPRHFASPARYGRVVERIAGFGTDVICLQEVDYALFAMVEKRLRALGYEGRWAHKGMGKPDGCAMFVGHDCRSSHWQVLVFDDAHVHGQGGKESGHIALMVDARVRGGRERIHVATTHFKWASLDSMPHVGVIQAGQFVHAVAKSMEDCPGSIVCGDFNAAPGSPLLTEFAEAGYDDAHAATTPTFMAEGRPQKLDYLLYTGRLQARAHEVPDLRTVSPLPSQDEPSDHLPLVATFFLEDF